MSVVAIMHSGITERGTNAQRLLITLTWGFTLGTLILKSEPVRFEER